MLSISIFYIFYTFNLKFIKNSQLKAQKIMLILLYRGFLAKVSQESYEKKTLKFGRMFWTLKINFFNIFAHNLKFVYVFFQMSLILPNLCKNCRVQPCTQNNQSQTNTLQLCSNIILNPQKSKKFCFQHSNSFFTRSAKF